jgi:acetyl-CoA carboxylase biotin carboxyl carrier protein
MGRGVSDAAPESEAKGLVELIDRLEVLLNESELSEIEVEAGSTALLLRKPGSASSIADSGAVAASPGTSSAAGGAGGQPSVDAEPINAIVAPLTGLFYSSPSPGAQPYVRPGAQLAVGQVIGLIEAMKLFNEIKSDRPGRVVRIVVEDGALVKAKQPLIEVEA